LALSLALFPWAETISRHYEENRNIPEKFKGLITRLRSLAPSLGPRPRAIVGPKGLVKEKYKIKYQLLFQYFSLSYFSFSLHLQIAKDNGCG